MFRSMKKFFKQGFKPSKCKTALRMANSRLKILQNKTEIQIKQLRRELAQLLESGQTPTARIRVEHLVNKEKRVAAYDLIGIYCELLVLRLTVIESQKNCPIDLKEAVASVLFASQRLSDVPEFSEIFKQFKTKYGKHFVTSAIELRPGSGVSRLLVEKLSAKAPDGPTKVKILLEIATEHNVVWEAKSFVEPDSRDTDYLGGASSFQSASSINVDSSRVQAPASVNVYHGSSERHHSLEKSYASDGKPSSRINNVSSRNADDNYHSNHGDVKSSSRRRQNWETEFVDSTDAARAAAEAAERASFAARAAAELSSRERMTRQDSTESHLSSASVNFRKKPSLRLDKSNLQNESVPDDTELRKYGSFGKSGNEKQTSFNIGHSEDVHLKKQSSTGSSNSQSSNYSDDNATGSEYKDHEKHSFPVKTKNSTEKEFRDQPSPKQKPVVPQIVASQDSKTPSREKASHVHPKLPDYDDIFERLGAFSFNRR